MEEGKCRYWSRWYIGISRYVFPAQKVNQSSDMPRDQRNLTVTTMPSLSTCAKFRYILVSAYEWVNGWSVATLHGCWRTVLKWVQYITGSHTQPWLVQSRVGTYAMNIIISCAHVQQRVWCRNLFPTGSRSMFQHVKRVLIWISAGVRPPRSNRKY